MCQSGIDYRGLKLALEQLSERESQIKKDIQAWADYFSEQGAADIAVELKNAAEAGSKTSEYLAKANHQIEHINEHEHGEAGHSHHVTVTRFSEAE